MGLVSASTSPRSCDQPVDLLPAQDYQPLAIDLDLRPDERWNEDLIEGNQLGEIQNYTVSFIPCQQFLKESETFVSYLFVKEAESRAVSELRPGIFIFADLKMGVVESKIRVSSGVRGG